MRTRYKLSRYTVLQECAETCKLSIYNTRSGNHALVDLRSQPLFRGLLEPSSPLLKTSNRTILAALRNGGFIVPVGTDELQVLRKDRDAALKEDYGVRLAVLPTLTCNFSCPYCFHGGSLPRGVMSEQTQQLLVSFTRRLLTSVSKGPLVVMWFGGEPLLELRRIRKLWAKFVSLAAEMNVILDGSMITNGYYLDLLTPPIASELALTSVQVTLDGPREVHDCRRPLVNGDPTFDRIISNLLVVGRHLPSITVRINVDHANYEEIPRLLRQLRDIGVFDHCRFSLCPIDERTGACTLACRTAFDSHSWAKVLNDIESEVLRLGIFDRMEEQYAMPWPLSCSAQIDGAFVVDPNGLLYKCLNDVAFPDRAVFDLRSNKQVNSTRAALLRASTPFGKKQCETCMVMPLCNAGCPSANIDGKTGGYSCSPRRFLLRERLARFAEAYQA